MNKPLKATVRAGRLVMDEPTSLPEGTEVHLVLVEDDVAESWMDAGERKAFQEELRASAEDEDAGRLIPADVVIAKLFATP